MSGFPPLVVRKRVVPDPAAPPLAAIATHNYINGDFVDRGDIELRSEGTDYLVEFDVLVLKVLLFGFDLPKAVSNAFNDAILARDDPTLLIYNLS